MRVCITGGTGTLGQALTKHFLRLSETQVVILSRDEVKQAQMAADFVDHPNLRLFLGDVRDRDRLVDAFYGCDIVIHAAALKRVDAVAYNPTEVRRTNIEGSANVLQAALKADVQRVLMISSDKACEPTNIYGVSKAAMEHETIAYNAVCNPRGMRASCVRYGNVLGSRGSVIHAWKAAAERGEPLPVTSTEMTRFWLTIDEAVSVVDRALDYMLGGEIFVPELKAAKMMLLASAVAPRSPIKIVGLRPGGEKTHETLITQHESLRTTWSDANLWCIAPEYYPWRPISPWEGKAAPYRANRSDMAEQLSFDDMTRMLKGLE